MSLPHLLGKTAIAMRDLVTAAVATSGLGLAGWISVGHRPILPFFAQGTILPSNEPMLDFAIRQGGALAVLLIVLFYYRRDYRDLTDYKSARDQMLVELVKESSKNSADMAAALRENNIVVHQAKNVMREYLPGIDVTGDRRR